MTRSFTKTVLLLQFIGCGSLVLACGGGSGSEPQRSLVSGDSILVETEEASSCSDGGITVIIGIDETGDGTIDSTNSETTICNGTPGQTGEDASECSLSVADSGVVTATCGSSSFPLNDGDDDGVRDGIDTCPDVSNKSQKDGDGDGSGDACDVCPNDPARTQSPDSDKDQVPNCEDECPDDAKKTEPGECGCGKSERDADNDGIPNCVDACPDDPEKIEAGVCGCGTSEQDADGDDYPDCVDECPDNPTRFFGCRHPFEWIVLIDGSGSVGVDGSTRSRACTSPSLPMRTSLPMERCQWGLSSSQLTSTKSSHSRSLTRPLKDNS